ncbi:DUF448 domain-containing protein [Helicobacter baculiformis]|uniref:DUF448 domain-containing protein n=1 Tax=Helicobacter baculiformis TaxID=427351 RepID=A0ABV7ZIK3_9HELI|nr:DUF448 domain-containing protein [Helicobacter baculiformis]
MKTSVFFSKNAVRTCVCCRERLMQAELLRFSVQGSKIVVFQGSGRSFYLCGACLHAKNVYKQVLKVRHAPKNKNYIQAWLEEVRAS